VNLDSPDAAGSKSPCSQPSVSALEQDSPKSGDDHLQKRSPLLLPPQERPRGAWAGSRSNLDVSDAAGSESRTSAAADVDKESMADSINLQTEIEETPGEYLDIADSAILTSSLTQCFDGSRSSPSQCDSPSIAHVSPQSAYVLLQRKLPLRIPMQQQEQRFGRAVAEFSSEASDSTSCKSLGSAAAGRHETVAVSSAEDELCRNLSHAQSGPQLPTLLSQVGGIGLKSFFTMTTGTPSDTVASSLSVSNSDKSAKSQQIAEEIRRERQARDRLRIFLLANGFRGVCSKKKGLLSYTHPLHVVVKQNDADMVTALLKAKADHQMKDSSGRTPLQLAMCKDNGLGSREAVLVALAAASAGAGPRV